mmetsp:Transcript_93734/g.157490  ORF Transcript_93734/g.157490 Transcript_93734/m.157490 type:complete len:433 (+) Transcript_93734:1121-2419(+)
MLLHQLHESSAHEARLALPVPTDTGTAVACDSNPQQQVQKDGGGEVQMLHTGQLIVLQRLLSLGQSVFEDLRALPCFGASGLRVRRDSGAPRTFGRSGTAWRCLAAGPLALGLAVGGHRPTVALPEDPGFLRRWWCRHVQGPVEQPLQALPRQFVARLGGVGRDNAHSFTELLQLLMPDPAAADPDARVELEHVPQLTPEAGQDSVDASHFIFQHSRVRREHHHVRHHNGPYGAQRCRTGPLHTSTGASSRRAAGCLCSRCRLHAQLPILRWACRRDLVYAIVQGSHKQQIVGGVQLMEVFCGHTELAPQELRALDAESGLHFEGHLFWGRRRVRHAASAQIGAQKRKCAQALEVVACQTFDHTFVGHVVRMRGTGDLSQVPLLCLFGDPIQQKPGRRFRGIGFQQFAQPHDATWLVIVAFPIRVSPVLCNG